MTAQMPPLITLPNPLTTAGRAFCEAPFLPGETLGAYVERNSVALPRSEFLVQHNGHYVPMHLWQRLIPRTGDQIVIHAIAQGGGDGGKTIAAVAMIALTLTAPYIAGYALTGTWATATGFAASALTTGIIVGGGLLITPMFPEIK